MTEAEIDAFVRAYSQNQAITCSREEYAQQIRPSLQQYAALCHANGDQVRAQIALEAIEELDGRLNVAE